jgi:hypothetical protein
VSCRCEKLVAEARERPRLEIVTRRLVKTTGWEVIGM